jgi:peroxiredoxin
MPDQTEHILGISMPNLIWSMAAVATATVWMLARQPAAQAAEHTAPQIGDAAPALSLTALDGSAFDLAALRGKVVLIHYWATWCVPCRKEMPKLNVFYRRYHDRGLELIGISIDFPRDAEKARKMARTFAYPSALTAAIADNGFGEQKAVPFTWIVDTDGKIRDMMIEVRDELLDGIVVPLLRHSAEPGPS